jgi:hypothetical protein
VFTAAFSQLLDLYSKKFFDRTQPAEWIWTRQSMGSGEPVAFFAARDFTLAANRIYTRIKILGDPEYTLFVNGQLVGGRRVPEGNRSLDYYDVSGLAKTGPNRIVVCIRSPGGNGGLLIGVDTAPEAENQIVSDRHWKIYRSWDPILLQYDIAGESQTPALLGEPPIGRWNYLQIERRAADVPPTHVLAANARFPFEGLLPAISTQGGVAVAVARKSRTTVFDFGPTRGRLKVTVARPRAFSRVVFIRFANVRPELGLVEWNLRPIVFAPGETEVTTPEEHAFRYAMAFASDATVEVLQGS